MQRSAVPFTALVLATSATFAWLIAAIFLWTPTAQFQAGGAAQKIFYFHVPAAYAMYLSGVVCGAASVGFLLRASELRNALAQAAAECAVAFGGLVLVSGPLWAKQAWGVYWTWEPRLTTSLLSVLVYAAVVVLRGFGGEGGAERKFAAALGVLGTANLPLIHVAVRQWGGQHPAGVIRHGSGGLTDPAMVRSLVLGFVAMTLLAAVLLWLRTGMLLLRGRLTQAEQRALMSGALEGS